MLIVRVLDREDHNKLICLTADIEEAKRKLSKLVGEKGEFIESIRSRYGLDDRCIPNPSGTPIEVSSDCKSLVQNSRRS